MLSSEHKQLFLVLCEQLSPEVLGELTPERQRVEYDRIMVEWRILELAVGRRISAFEVVPLPAANVRKFRTGALRDRPSPLTNAV